MCSSPNKRAASFVCFRLTHCSSNNTIYSWDCITFNFRPVSNLRFVSTCKLIENAVFLQPNDYLLHNGLHEPLQSAYKALHSTETAFIRVHDDIRHCTFCRQQSECHPGAVGYTVCLRLSTQSCNHEILLPRLHQHLGINDTRSHAICQHRAFIVKPA